MRSSARSLILLLAAGAAAGAARAQSLDALVMRVGAMSAVTGMEDAMADSLRALLPGATRDRAGNVVLVRGSGSPVRLAACPMDEIGYVVGSITAEGYLTLRRVGASAVGPLYDQFLEGHRVTVFGRRGPVPGVVGVRSTHLARGRPADNDPPFSLDNAWVDVGAASAAQAGGLGIAVLSPVTRAKRVHRYGAQDDLAAAPWIAERSACAALLGAARRAGAPSGTTVVAFTARRHFAHDGTTFLMTRYPGADVVLVGDGSTAPLGAGPGEDHPTVGGRTVASWTLPTRYARTPVETVAMGDVTQLEQKLAAWLGGGR